MSQVRSKYIERPTCPCGKPVARKGWTLKGFPTWQTGCDTCRYKARKFRAKQCKICGSKKNLEIDHIDSDRSNNTVDNLQTLCRRCHIQKTNEYDERKVRPYENM
jgi:5-methylcytosine-specific restriction endonuclease McrA